MQVTGLALAGVAVCRGVPASVRAASREISEPILPLVFAFAGSLLKLAETLLCEGDEVLVEGSLHDEESASISYRASSKIRVLHERPGAVLRISSA